mmetsp:Transcript_12214/g.25892  ORF Transcript_12214/g.25892 Transcript_12214/m.25892 type:complete len:264 (+) Transcript_12214:252-1043(+)|eukprot:CAMPEP_0178657168 /NCGR_PEP_ID=MMETSP0698-20121128/25229_1 /TAXON_ID=265572 /ORGANISM="Extubocellulus spinifer, Strain CCMP396" /LENGTH=263 /DNA_ID=CAMNT_0020299303 /DNA_START=244 /DNA_END=1035 /DNA_ORIENTATION=-
MKLLATAGISSFVVLAFCSTTAAANVDIADSSSNDRHNVRRRGLKSDKTKQPKCVEVENAYCNSWDTHCCVDAGKSLYLQCDNNKYVCKAMKDKDIEKYLAATGAAAAAGTKNAGTAGTTYNFASSSSNRWCEKDKDCCDDRECLNGDCVKPKCPKECNSNDDCKPCDKDCISGKCSSYCPSQCSSDKDCRECDKVCISDKCSKPKCDWCEDDHDCRACDKKCNASQNKCYKPSCPDACTSDNECKPCGEKCMGGKCDKDCIG